MSSFTKSVEIARESDITYVIKRNGTKEPVNFDKITLRIQKIIDEGNLNCNATLVAQKVIAGMGNSMYTSELDKHSADISCFLVKKHPDYEKLAAMISISNLHKMTSGSFLEVIEKLKNNVYYGESAPLVNDRLYKIVQENHEKIQSVIDYSRDYLYGYFGYKTLEEKYIIKINGVHVERPQDMLMRVALGIHYEDLDNVFETYRLMSQHFFTHATPTLFNAGTLKPQMASCFLLAMKDDSLEGIYATLTDSAMISKGAGGLGIHISNIRASESYIKGTNGKSNGVVPMIKVFNETARYVDQGGGKRKGSFAIYLEPWHADFENFIDMAKLHGNPDLIAKDVFYAAWIPDLFMKRVRNDEMWSFFCPMKAPGLADVYGEEFEKLYEKYENEKLYNRQIEARTLWIHLLTNQIENGKLYVMFKDACNEKSNQKNLGTIKSSNLCTEIVQYTDKNETAVCNLASISLPNFVDNDLFDHEMLRKVVQQITYNLNKVIDENHYPIKEAKVSNERHRPIGIGVQGLANVFISLKLQYESKEALDLNNQIFETIYFAAIEKSCEMAQKDGYYESFPGSPISQGKFQFDLCMDRGEKVELSGRWDWESLRKDVIKYGVRNSLVTALMPTASTAQILGNNESFEPFVSNMYVREVSSGSFVYFNKHLIKELVERGMWNEATYNQLVQDGGSIENLDLDESTKALYKTVWDMKLKPLVDMASGRGAFIDQSQSMNIWITRENEKDVRILHSYHMYAWEKGLKTSTYYCHTRTVGQATKFVVSNVKTPVDIVCSRDNKDCLMCSS